jgi:hypothetical protein
MILQLQEKDFQVIMRRLDRLNAWDKIQRQNKLWSEIMKNCSRGNWLFCVLNGDDVLRTPSTGLLLRVALVRTDVPEERIAFIIRVTSIVEQVTKLVNYFSKHLSSFCSLFQLLVAANVVPSSLILVIPKIEAIISSEPSVLTTATRHNIPGNSILPSHRRESLKSYIGIIRWAL